MNYFNWLHLTDLHWGMKDQGWLWPNVKESFFEDLKVLHDKSGPWDLVLFTGDLVQQGSTEEFTKLNEVLKQWWERFYNLGSSPQLLAVPGNHDLLRPDLKKDLAARLLTDWDVNPDIQAEFWEDPGSPYRKTIETAFASYSNWWDVQTFKPDNMTAGLLPGDFSATLEKNGMKLGIIGFNTAFLQLTGGDYAGKLALDTRQFHEACDGDGPGWVKQHHVCLLITHHSAAWLNPTARQHFEAEIMAKGRFAVHLCGHLHTSDFQEHAEAGTERRSTWQSRSLCGLEYYGEDIERQHGYTAGRIELIEDEGRLLFWPREARIQGYQRQMVPDFSIHLTDEQHTQARSIKLHRSVPAFPSLKKADIFVSYAREDDKPHSPHNEGWVTALTDALQNLLKFNPAGNCVVWQDAASTDETVLSLETQAQLKNSEILLVILSPAYLASQRCGEELETFLGKPNSSADSVFVVEYEAVENAENFYKRFNCKYFVDAVEEVYYPKLRDLSREIAEQLSALRTPRQGKSTTTDTSLTIFLAEVTDDLGEQYEDIKRYFVQQNIKVLPEKPYFFDNERQLCEAMKNDLEKSLCFVQLLSHCKPRRSWPGMPTPILQYSYAKQKNLPILQWRDLNLDLSRVNDPMQKKLLTTEHVMAMRFEEFKGHVIQQITKPPPSPPLNPGELVFINAAPRDMPLAHEIKQQLIEKGFGFCLPLEPSDETKAGQIRADLERNLLFCNAVIVLYADATSAEWVREQLLYCHRMQGMREQPLKVIALCIKSTHRNKPPLNISLPRMLTLECPALQADTGLPRFIEALQA